MRSIPGRGDLHRSHRSLDRHCEGGKDANCSRTFPGSARERGERQFLGNGMARDEGRRPLRARCNHRVCEPRHTTYSRSSEHSASLTKLFRSTRREMTSDDRLNDEGEPFLPLFLLFFVSFSPSFSSSLPSSNLKMYELH